MGVTSLGVTGVGMADVAVIGVAMIGRAGAGITAAAVRVPADAWPLGVHRPFRLLHPPSPASSSEHSLYRARM